MNDLTQDTDDLAEQFLHRDYPSWIVSHVKQRAIEMDQKQLCASKDLKPLDLINKYSQLGGTIKN